MQQHTRDSIGVIFGVRRCKPRVSKVDPLGLLIDHQTLQLERIIIPLEAMVILSEPAEISLDYLLYLLLRELRTVGAPIAELQLQVVVVLALEDQIKTLLV